MIRSFKQIKCIDCAIEFQPTNSSQRRCEMCQELYYKESKTARQKIRRNAKKT